MVARLFFRIKKSLRGRLGSGDFFYLLLAADELDDHQRGRNTGRESADDGIDDAVTRIRPPDDRDWRLVNYHRRFYFIFHVFLLSIYLFHNCAG